MTQMAILILEGYSKIRLKELIFVHVAEIRQHHRRFSYSENKSGSNFQGTTIEDGITLIFIPFSYPLYFIVN